VITNLDESGAGMEIRQLEYFVAVAEELHFGRAAERLHIGQPAVSQQIARLEREFAVHLFDRSTRRVRLTAAGIRLLPEARASLAVLERLRLTVVEPNAELNGPLRVGTSEGLGERLDRVLESLATIAPALEVRLLSMPLPKRLDAVRAGDLDAAFVRPAVETSSLEVSPVWTESLVAALPATHPLAAQSMLGLSDLADVPLRMSEREANSAIYDLVVNALREAGVDPPEGPVISSMYDALSEIGTGAPAWTVLYASAAERLQIRRVAFRNLGLPPIQTLLVRPTGPPSEVVRLLLDSCLSAR
jgi:DNA-binding transcriptional LysR family regulator